MAIAHRYGMAHASKERRYLTQELRAKRSTGGATIEGYAAKFGIVSEDLGGFREVLLPGCFDLAGSPDVICNYEHDDCAILGRTSSGTLKIAADEVGLRFECAAPPTALGNDVCALIERGDLKGNSFAFEVSEGGEEWGKADDGLPLRKITRCLLYDVAVVVHPAYADTELALRSLAQAQTPPTPRNVNCGARLRLAEACA